MTDDRPRNQEQGYNGPLAELLSAYLDDRESLSSTELEHVERLLEQDGEARQAYAELREIARGLGSLEPISAPRTYHLDAEMVGAPEPVVLQESAAWYARHTETVRWITAAAAVLFVFVLGADLVLNNVLSDPASPSSDAFNADQAEVTSRIADDDDSDDAAPAAGESEELEESAGVEDESGNTAPPVATPEAADSAGETGLAADEDEQSDGEAGADAAPTPEPSMLEGNPGVDESATGDGEADAADMAEDGAVDETAGDQQALMIEESGERSADSGDSRRGWRIVEFGLVVLLGVLITLMVVMPRLGAASARDRGR